MYRKNTAGQFIHVQGVDATTGGIKSGVTWTVRRCLDGTFAAATGTVTEDGTTGWYKFALSQADTNGNDCGFNFTGTGAVPQTVNIVTTAADPTDATRFGLSALPNAAAGANGGLPLSVDAAGRVDVLKVNGTSQTARDLGLALPAAAPAAAGGLLISAAGITGATLDADLGRLDAAITSRSTYAGGAVASVTAAVTVGGFNAGAITDAAFTFPAEAAGRPTTFLAAMRRVWEWVANKRTRDRSTGTMLLRNAADGATLETQTQSTVGTTDTITQGA